ncbi:unnamed protein product [Plutella xylostella]|uniref:(diamondback moth) hypothetical protein n=1 Tax=Plutella xylostella TaxID=51655 RepID=A0A8S4FPM2_PLUXY|nr:unnamed protein product [Plutella xylostella]
MSQPRSRASRAAEEADADPDLGEAINECARFLICREGSKIPIKRAEIQKFLAPNFQIPSNRINVVISEANKLIRKVYGCKLVQVEAKSGVQFIVVLAEEAESLPDTSSDPVLHRMLVAALTHLFMSGGRVTEEAMWDFLDEAGLMEEADHAGRKDFITTFTKQLYLSYFKVGEGDLTRHVFEWGQRAIEEVPPIHLLTKMSQAFEREPVYWREQHTAATGDNGIEDRTAEN